VLEYGTPGSVGGRLGQLAVLPRWQTAEMLTIRRASAADAAAARELGENAFAELRSVYEPSPLAKEMHAGMGELGRLVAEADGRFVGTVRYRVSGMCLHVTGLAVSPDSRSRGIARRLITQLASLAKERGCSKMGLYAVEQTGNVAVFERLGFHVVAASPAQYSISVDGRPLTEAYMERAVA